MSIYSLDSLVFHMHKLEPLFCHVCMALFIIWLLFLFIRRSKTPISNQRFCIFLAIKAHLLIIFDGKVKCAEICNLIEQLCIVTLFKQQKNNGIIFVVQS